MRLSKIEEQPFIFGRHDFVMPVMRVRFVPHISSKNRERVAMMTIPSDHLPTCVAAGENNCKSQSKTTPPINTRESLFCSHRPMAGLVYSNTSRRQAHSAVATGIPQVDLRREQQTQR